MTSLLWLRIRNNDSPKKLVASDYEVVFLELLPLVTKAALIIAVIETEPTQTIVRVSRKFLFRTDICAQNIALFLIGNFQ